MARFYGSQARSIPSAVASDRRDVERAGPRLSEVQDVLAAEERHRRRVVQSVHDGPLQLLAIAGQELAEAASGDPKALILAQGALAEGIAKLRELLAQLTPDLVGDRDLTGHLRALCEAIARGAGLAITVDVGPGVDGAADALALVAARELVMNCVEHAEALRVQVRLRREGETLALRVADDGQGAVPEFLEAVLTGAGGLASLRSRLAAVGGTLQLLAAPGSGVVATVRLPLAP